MDVLVFFINVHAGLEFLSIVCLVWLMETNTSHWMLYPRLDFNLEDGVWINLLLNSYFTGYLAGFTSFHFSFPRKVAAVRYWETLSQSLILFHTNQRLYMNPSYCKKHCLRFHLCIMGLDVKHSEGRICETADAINEVFVAHAVVIRLVLMMVC